MTPNDGQMTFLRRTMAAPLRVGPKHYVAVLQNKPGELDALQHASSGVWERLIPLLEFVGPKTKRNPLTSASVSAWVKRADRALGPRPLYVDILRLDPRTRVETKGGTSWPVLDYIYSAARRRGMATVPVLRVGES